MKRRFLCILIVFLLCISACGVPALAADGGPYPDELYLTQSRGGRCTLCAAAMMIRARLYLEDSGAALDVTEQDLAGSAWCSDGLYWSFTYTADGLTMSVAHASVSGMSAAALRALLDEHPEGVVLYCGYWPHAVFVTDWDGGVFYCGEPAAGERCALADSVLGSCGSQSDILKNVTAYWYIDDVTEA